MPKYYPKGKENESVKRSSWKELIEEFPQFANLLWLKLTELVHRLNQDEKMEKDHKDKSQND